jgi:hypothetical protein
MKIGFDISKRQKSGADAMNTPFQINLAIKNIHPAIASREDSVFSTPMFLSCFSSAFIFVYPGLQGSSLCA